MKAATGQVWSSELRIVNVNNYDIQVYPQVVNFEPLDETGRVNLLFNEAESDFRNSLASWVQISSEPIIVPEQQTITIPFSVAAPIDAQPGGHYAAILIGTRPPESEGSSSRVQTAQFVSSLLFVRIDGEIVEQGTIREFRAEKKVVPSSEVGLELRFENTGNVYLQPQGDIVIYNMWGTERGVIPINHQTHYGRVVQNSIREFIFSWKGETTFLDIGRYRAVATLGYGESSKNFVTKETYFWIIPYQQIAVGILIITAIILFIGWIVRLYIRRMLILAGIDPISARARMGHTVKTLELRTVRERVPKTTSILLPLTQGVLDVRSRILLPSTLAHKARALGQIVIAYRLFFVSLIGVIMVVSSILWYILAVSNENKEYEVTIGNPEASISVSSEEVFYQNLKIANPVVTDTKIAQDYTIDVVNRSGMLGIAAELRMVLERKGYTISSLKTEIGESTNRTVIVFHPEQQEQALALSQALSGALLSASDSHRIGAITIFAGTDAAR